MEKFTKELDEAMSALMERYRTAVKKPHDYGGCGILLYMSDIHMIEAVGNHPDLNITELANFLGFTKGTVSKLTQKLERQGFIRRFQYKDNKKETYLFLTELGRRAYEGHYAYHEAKSAKTHEQYKKYTPEQQALILQFIRTYCSYMEDYR